MKNILQKSLAPLTIGIAILATAVATYAASFTLVGNGTYSCSATSCTSRGTEQVNGRREYYQEWAAVSGNTVNGSIGPYPLGFVGDAIRFACVLDITKHQCTGTYTHQYASGSGGTFSQTFDGGVPGTGTTSFTATGN